MCGGVYMKKINSIKLKYRYLVWGFFVILVIVVMLFLLKPIFHRQGTHTFTRKKIPNSVTPTGIRIISPKYAFIPHLSSLQGITGQHNDVLIKYSVPFIYAGQEGSIIRNDIQYTGTLKLVFSDEQYIIDDWNDWCINITNKTCYIQGSQMNKILKLQSNIDTEGNMITATLLRTAGELFVPIQALAFYNNIEGDTQQGLVSYALLLNNTTELLLSGNYTPSTASDMIVNTVNGQVCIYDPYMEQVFPMKDVNKCTAPRHVHIILLNNSLYVSVGDVEYIYQINKQVLEYLWKVYYKP